MLCEKCKVREANIKYTEIINGVKRSIISAPTVRRKWILDSIRLC